MILTQTNRRFRSYAIYALGALLCLCFSLWRSSPQVIKRLLEKGFSGPHEPKKESTSSPNRGSAEL